MSADSGERWWVTPAGRARHLSPACAAGAARQSVPLRSLAAAAVDVGVYVDELLAIYEPCGRCCVDELLTLEDRGRLVVARSGRRRRRLRAAARARSLHSVRISAPHQVRGDEHGTECG